MEMQIKKDNQDKQTKILTNENTLGEEGEKDKGEPTREMDKRISWQGGRFPEEVMEQENQGQGQSGMIRAQSQTFQGVAQIVPQGKTSLHQGRCDVTLRDLAIFSFLELFGMASLGQLWAAFFKGISQETVPWLFHDRQANGEGLQSAAYLRLKKLVRFGFLERGGNSSYPSLFKLTAKGHWQLVKRNMNSLSRSPNHWPKEQELSHALTINACALVISKVLGLEVQSERQINRDLWLKARNEPYCPREVLPDLIVHCQDKNLKFEVELSLKADQRYMAYWESLGPSMRGQEPQLLYVTGTAAINDHLLGIARSKYFPGLYACDLNSFKSTLGQYDMANMLGQTWNLAAKS